MRNTTQEGQMSEVHEVLVKARNGMERDGFDAMVYGGPACGTPRCALGWVGLESGDHIGWGSGSKLVRMLGTSDPYAAAIAALWEARPFTPPRSSEARPLAAKVERVALDLGNGRIPEVFAWFDRAISATAPEPADPFPQAEPLVGIAPDPGVVS